MEERTAETSGLFGLFFTGTPSKTSPLFSFFKTTPLEKTKKAWEKYASSYTKNLPFSETPGGRNETKKSPRPRTGRASLSFSSRRLPKGPPRRMGLASSGRLKDRADMDFRGLRMGKKKRGKGGGGEKTGKVSRVFFFVGVSSFGGVAPF